MKTIPMVRATTAAMLVTVLAGCVVFPTHVYVPDAADGKLVYERCSLNPYVPIGVMVERPGLQATVSLVQQRDGGYVAVQFDLPEHHVLALRQDTIVIDAKGGDQPTRTASIRYVNPIGPAYYDFPEVQKRVLPWDTELKGGRIDLGTASFDRHYWIAGRFVGRVADEVWVTLPRFALDGVVQELPALHFDRQLMIARGLFNC